MDELSISKTVLSPDIILNKKDNFFLLSGKSVVENAEDFYNPILKWFKNYFNNPNKNTEIIFFLEYLNSSSSLQIGNIIESILKNKDKTKIVINWLYESSDELALEAGKEFQYIYQFKFNFIELEDEYEEVFEF